MGLSEMEYTAKLHNQMELGLTYSQNPNLSQKSIFFLLTVNLIEQLEGNPAFKRITVNPGLGTHGFLCAACPT